VFAKGSLVEPVAIKFASLSRSAKSLPRRSIVACDYGTAQDCSRYAARKSSTREVAVAPASNVHDPQHWLERAAAMRLLAGEIKSEEAKAIMLRLAVDYDKLADRADERRRKNATTAKG